MGMVMVIIIRRKGTNDILLIQVEANKLSKKGYHNIVVKEKYHTPEFIIMFIPNENVFLIVKELLNKDTNMIAEGVILAGPDNLNFIILMWHYINGILKVQDQIEDIRNAATQIHNRFGTAAELSLIHI